MLWVKTGTTAFRKALSAAETRGATDAAKVAPVVAEVIARIRQEGDAALADYTRKFDRFDPVKHGFAVSPKAIDAAWKRTPADLRESLELAAARIEAFHLKQRQEGYELRLPGAQIGNRVLAQSADGTIHDFPGAHGSRQRYWSGWTTQAPMWRVIVLQGSI